MNRTKNAVRNIGFGFLYRICMILFPFAVRTVMIYVMGNEYAGLNSLFTSILSFLSLAELGVGVALVYNMYKPIAENNPELICALLNLYRKLYRYIGIIIMVLGLFLVPFLKYLVKIDVDVNVNIYCLYFIFLFNTVISYWLFGYKQSLLQAHQRNDMVSRVALIVQSLMYVLQIAALMLFKNYYAYIILLPIFTVITNVVTSNIVDKMYPQYSCRGEVSQEIKDSIRKKVLALVGTKANSAVLHAADNIVISAFLGISVVGKYGNYYYIMNSIVAFMTIVYSSITAGIGNSIVVDKKEKIYNDFSAITFLNMWLIMFCSACLLCLYQPFMKIWVGEDLMFEFDIVVLLIIYFYVYQARRVVLTYKDAAGIWWEDRLRPYVCMGLNLVSNLILVQVLGIYGIILSTIISMLVVCPWETFTVFKYVFNRKMDRYFVKMGLYTGISVLAILATYAICCMLPFSGILALAIRFAICLIIPNILFLLTFMRTKEFKMVKTKVVAKLRK